MTDKNIEIIAYIVANIISKKHGESHMLVTDISRDSPLDFQGTFTDENIVIQCKSDHGRITVDILSNDLLVYKSCDRKFIQLKKRDEKKFTGIDYASGECFDVEIEKSKHNIRVCNEAHNRTRDFAYA